MLDHNYCQTTTNSPRSHFEKNRLMKYPKGPLKLSSLKNRNFSLIKKRKKLNDQDSPNNDLSTSVISSNMRRLLDNSFDSRKSNHSSISIQRIDTTSNNDFLKDIEIKDTDEGNISFIGKTTEENQYAQLRKQRKITDKRENFIYIGNLQSTTIVHNGINYHKKNRNEFKGIGLKLKENNSNLNMTMKSENTFNALQGNNNDDEVLKLKKEITNLLEKNLQLEKAFGELKVEHSQLSKENDKLRKFITDNKMEDITVLQKKLDKYIAELKKCKEEKVIASRQKKINELQIEERPQIAIEQTYNKDISENSQYKPLNTDVLASNKSKPSMIPPPQVSKDSTISRNKPQIPFNNQNTNKPMTRYHNQKAHNHHHSKNQSFDLDPSQI